MKEKTKKIVIVIEIVVFLALASLVLLPFVYHTSSNTYTSNSSTGEEVDFLIDEKSSSSPVVKISADINSGKSPLKISFKAGVSDDGRIVSYKWDFDNGETSEEQNPVHVFEMEGTYDVVLTVVDDMGEKGKDTIIIRVVENKKPQAYATYYSNRLFWYQTAPIVVYFRGRGIDEDGEIVGYHWEFGPMYRSIIPYRPFRYWRYQGHVPFYWSSYDSDEQNPVRILAKPGYYWAKLTVTDNDGATDTDTVNIYLMDFVTTVKETIKEMFQKN